MERAKLARLLVEAQSDAEREALLAENSALCDAALAYALKDICLDGWSGNPLSATHAGLALRALADQTGEREIQALAAWGEGLVALVQGQMESAITHLDEAEAIFLSLNKPHTAASTQVGKLIALATLGQYDEAIACGLRARDVFVEHKDMLAAGKIENNIGNIYRRRDRYQEAEQFQLAARARFLKLNDQKHLIKIDNCLANIYSLQHKFRDAEQLYQQALSRADAKGLTTTQAEIECSIGELSFFQGRYDRALDYLERSRRKYSALDMPHQAAIVEQEIADAYLELNLAPEAASIYERITAKFVELGMRAEQARAEAQHGRALILLDHAEEAHQLLTEASRLYAAEGNAVGEAMVKLTEAQLHYMEGNYGKAETAAAEAEAPFALAGTWRRLLMARWLRGETARAQGKTQSARRTLEATLSDALEQTQPQVAQRCYTSLGLLAAKEGDHSQAESFYRQAVTLIEELRAPLPAEEFRTAFFADKLVPYDELVRICLADDNQARIREAFGFVERARSRALVDRLGSALSVDLNPRDTFEAELLTEVKELREELNWFYSQINRPLQKESAVSADEMAGLHESIRERENRMLEIMRQLQHRGQHIWTQVEPLDVSSLQHNLGAERALVEYTTLDDELLAFVVTDEGVRIQRYLGNEREVSERVAQLRFQIDALRYGSREMRRHLKHLTARVSKHLETLYDLLIRPLEELIGDRHLIVVPHRALHYVPFHALYDGTGYVVEEREVSYTPSAVVLRHCLSKPVRPLQSALLFGVADEQTPRVRDEIRALAPLFPEATTLLDESATLAAMQERASRADLLHLACHGQFRPDNPLFSSLRLGDGWLTVRDTYSLNLQCGLVALSACETGVSAVAPGDELIGLARGFISAGAPTLLLSLWTVDDEATAELMISFYSRLRDGERPAAALRLAQLEAMTKQPHPFFWSPFVLVGRP